MSVLTSPDTIRAGSVGVFATAGTMTTNDWIQLFTLLFIIFQVVVILPKVIDTVKGTYAKFFGKEK